MTDTTSPTASPAIDIASPVSPALPDAAADAAPQARSAATFEVLPLSRELRETLAEIGYTHPTPVQIAVWEPATRGQDAVVQARTGTGKTAAFGLPIVDHLVRRSMPQVQVLTLTPTRELALQVSREIERLGKRKNVKVTAIYGGAPMQKQVDEINDGAQVIVGTPGRVLDHLRRGTLDPKHIKLLVLDEADEMLSMGFEREVTAILDSLPKDRQTLLFSATLPPDIERMAKKLRKPEYVTLSGDHVGALEIEHFVYFVAGDKLSALTRMIEVENPEGAVVFCNTKDETERVAQTLARQGYDADWLNGDLPQSDRETVMAKTRAGKLRFLVATDVAARGIDISHLTHVINFDYPQDSESYVHRTGRTGRAGRTGTAISLITPRDVGGLYLLRLTYKIRPVEKQIPSEGELRTRAEADLVSMLAEAFASRTVHPDDLTLARRLLTHEQFDVIVAGLLRDHLGARPDAQREATASRKATRMPPPPPRPPQMPKPAPRAERAPVVSAPVVSAPVERVPVARPAAPVVSAPVVSAPVVSAPVERVPVARPAATVVSAPAVSAPVAAPASVRTAAVPPFVAAVAAAAAPPFVAAVAAAAAAPAMPAAGREDRPRGEQPRWEQPRSEQQRGEQARGEQARGEQQRGEQQRGEQARGEQQRGEQQRGEQARGEQARGEQQRGEQQRGEQQRGEQPRWEQPRGEQARGEQPRGEQPRVEQPRVEQARVEQPRDDRRPRFDGDRGPRPEGERGGQRGRGRDRGPAPGPDARRGRGDHVPVSAAMGSLEGDSNAAPTRHADFTSWQPAAEEGDDEPILGSEAQAPRRPHEARAPYEARPAYGGGQAERPREQRDSREQRDQREPREPREPRNQPREATPEAAIVGGGAPAELDEDLAEIYVNVGRRDGARASDFQRILTEVAGLDKANVRRIRVRERNAFVSVRKQDLVGALAALSGATIAGKTAGAEQARERGADDPPAEAARPLGGEDTLPGGQATEATAAPAAAPAVDEAGGNDDAVPTGRSGG
jgi:ATP-dependent RNA helicase DeaD